MKVFLKTEIGLIEEEIRLVLNEYNSSFMTYEIETGMYTFKRLSETLFNILRPENELFNNSVDIEVNDIIKKTKMVVRPGIIAIRFEENMFLVLS